MTIASARRRLVAALVAGLAIALAPAVETSAAPGAPSPTKTSHVDMSTRLGFGTSTLA